MGSNTPSGGPADSGPVQPGTQLLNNPAFGGVFNLPDGGNSSFPYCSEVEVDLTTYNFAQTFPPYYVWAWSPSATNVPQFTFGANGTRFKYQSPWPPGSTVKYILSDSQYNFGTSTTFTHSVANGTAQCPSLSTTPYINLALPQGAPRDCSNATLLVGGGGVASFWLYYTNSAGAVGQYVWNAFPQTLSFNISSLAVDSNAVDQTSSNSEVWFVVEDFQSRTSNVLNLTVPSSGNCSLRLQADPVITSLVSPSGQGGGSTDHAGVIAGSVIGGAIGIIIATVVGFIFYRRGRRKGIQEAGGMLEYQDKTYSPESAGPGYPTYNPNAPPVLPHHQSGLQEASTSPPAQESATVRSTDPIYVQHEDYEDLAPSSSGGVVDLPPIYSHTRSASQHAPGMEMSSVSLPTQTLVTGLPSATTEAPSPQLRDPQPLMAKGFMPNEV